MRFHIILQTSSGRSEAGYRAGLSRRRSRVRAPPLALEAFLNRKAFFLPENLLLLNFNHTNKKIFCIKL